MLKGGTLHRSSRQLAHPQTHRRSHPLPLSHPSQLRDVLRGRGARRVQSRSQAVKCAAVFSSGDGAASGADTNSVGAAHSSCSSKPLVPWLPQLSWPARGSSVRTNASGSESSPSTSSGGGDGDGSNNSGSSGGGGGGGGGDDDGDSVLPRHQVDALCKERGISLPPDMLEIASKIGLRMSAIEAYLAMQNNWLGRMLGQVPYFRDRLMADKMFAFKVGAEVTIDMGCATVAEVRKRGDDFWNEFEFYMSDLLVGLVMDVVLVSLMAPAAVLGGGSKAGLSTSWLQKQLSKVPSAVFEPSRPGVKQYTLGNRLSCLIVKFGEYSVAGFGCGLLGQGIANALMVAKRQIRGTKEDDVKVPPLLQTALVWGLFMGVSSNVRYQAVYGIERLVEMTIAKKIPQLAYATTVGARFTNNIVGEEQMIDMAKATGIQ